MNSSNIRNIIIIVVIGGLIILGTYMFLGRRGGPQSLDQPASGQTFQSWYTTTSDNIAKGNAASALSDIEAKLDPSQFGNREPGMKYFLLELRGDALVKLNRCGDAVESYEQALGNLGSAQFLFVRDDGKDPREQMISDAERNAQKSRIEGKLQKAQQCAN